MTLQQVGFCRPIVSACVCKRDVYIHIQITCEEAMFDVEQDVVLNGPLVRLIGSRLACLHQLHPAVSIHPILQRQVAHHDIINSATRQSHRVFFPEPL